MAVTFHLKRRLSDERKLGQYESHERSTSTGASPSPVQWLLCLAVLLCALEWPAQPGKQVIFERISQYHHIQVYDEGGIRTLSFNGSWETKMSLSRSVDRAFRIHGVFSDAVRLESGHQDAC